MIQVSPVRRKKCSLLFPFAVVWIEVDDKVTQKCALYTLFVWSAILWWKMFVLLARRRRRREKKTFSRLNFWIRRASRTQSSNLKECISQEKSDCDRFWYFSRRWHFFLLLLLLPLARLFFVNSSFVIYQIDKTVHIHKTKIWSIWLLSFEIVIGWKPQNDSVDLFMYLMVQVCVCVWHTHFVTKRKCSANLVEYKSIFRDMKWL